MANDSATFMLLSVKRPQKSLGLNPSSCGYAGLCPAARPLVDSHRINSSGLCGNFFKKIGFETSVANYRLGYFAALSKKLSRKILVHECSLQREARACLQTPAAEMMPEPVFVRGRPRREGTRCTEPRGPKGVQCHRPITNGGYKSERGPEGKDAF